MSIYIPIADQREVVLITRRRVMEITGYTAEEIAVLQFELAFDWLEMIGCVGDMETQMASTPEFWDNFWRPEWHRLDLVFLKTVNQFHPSIDYKQRYYYCHSSMRYLNDDKMHASYHQVIKSIAKAKVV